MRILVNQHILRLFRRVTMSIAGFSLISVIAVSLQWRYAALCVAVCALCMAALSLSALYLYFREQERIMEQAVMQIRAYLAGNQAARIDCDEEGELYRLFHEVNSLVAILKAHAENEGSTKRFLKDTISNISHQLKTPLAALNIYNGLLQEEARELPAIRELTDLSEQELDRIQTLVQSLLKIAKLDSGTIVLEKAEESLSELMDCMERHFSYRAELEQKKLIFCGEDSITLLCDRAWLMEALSNLVKNAFDHTRAGNTISIEWKRFGSMIQITVRDNGSGIPPEDLPHIFKRFYRSRFSKDTQGVGLGLPLAKAIMEAHNGTLEADSDPASGTIFTINFLIPAKL